MRLLLVGLAIFAVALALLLVPQRAGGLSADGRHILDREALARPQVHASGDSSLLFAVPRTPTPFPHRSLLPSLRHL
jgi:hypothetical protein